MVHYFQFVFYLKCNHWINYNHKQLYHHVTNLYLCILNLQTAPYHYCKSFNVFEMIEITLEDSLILTVHYFYNWNVTLPITYTILRNVNNWCIYFATRLNVYFLPKSKIPETLFDVGELSTITSSGIIKILYCHIVIREKPL